MSSLRKWLVAGLLILVPLIITWWVLDWVVGTLDQSLGILPVAWHPDQFLGVHIPGLGVIFALIVVLALGALASNIIGNRLVVWWHDLLQRIPVVRSVYSSVKQISDTVFAEKGNAFRKAMLVQWPHEGMWTIGFLTGAPTGNVLDHLVAQAVPVPADAAPGATDFLSIFVPTTPNPTGGYFIMVRRIDCVELRMSVDEALTYIVSMGVIAPGSAKRTARKGVAGPLPPPSDTHP